MLRVCLRAIAVCAACCALWSGAVLAAPSPDRPLRILTLGDSITAGIAGDGHAPEGGYRAPLERLLNAAPYPMTLVGSRTDFSPHMSAPGHDGYPGYVIRATSTGAAGQLYGGIARTAIQRTHPDVILLMVGTNDFLRYEADRDAYSVDTMVESMDMLLAEIFTTAPHVRVIVGAIVNSPKVDRCYVARFDTGRSPCDRRTHPSLAGLVREYAAHGYAISYAASMYDALARDAAHFPDGIHPLNGPKGYDAMARVWYESLQRSEAAYFQTDLATRTKFKPKTFAKSSSP